MSLFIIPLRLFTGIGSNSTSLHVLHNSVQCHEYALIQLKVPFIALQTATNFDEQRYQLTVGLPLPAGLFHAAQSKAVLLFQYKLRLAMLCTGIGFNIIYVVLPVLEYFPEKIVCHRGLRTLLLLL
ncbi:hypothetical protein T4B_2746 [Trichinella pseudospiralis]|uniref:Uncharacterized protein n=1 Tax=Trichinella pseudospiralis TaxID=6337 RepID=A0A0V1KAR6_TRIPS|nr:hypothetical protein T4A_14441 [Trichinella pseudospiralis]KRZ28683.1 hypothetical protein T4B_2746 [Trichinella pseudospiralis]KRZ44330.1 hypothetical protein T4C_10688 [Trichinella pseudospiralis]